ncbi:glycoside hydrolase family 125 protein [Hydnum rufescens UP504]|uniref:Glycoside hydrolase family 125 protein n=1 Tax=Hydnum rufescens UP504 TaxID=1448309 RepID=A0A9P6AGI1_9AGAM|nr:glycoside hydrolase family 125 protein [Hydnum rufescens UP504]
MTLVTAACPNYASYSQQPHAPLSSGTLKLPYMRPSPECRTFNSPAVEKVIADMKMLLKDPDLARLFENTFPNTLDTTVRYFNKTENVAFIITGISNSAQWLRDTANQFAHYHDLLKDPDLGTLVRGVINNEARYIARYPYCGAFQPPPESHLAPTHNDWANLVTVIPPVDNQMVFECKYELDSLGGFLKLSRSYHQATGDTSFADGKWLEAIFQIFRVIDEQSQATFDADFNIVTYYSWTGQPGSLAGPVNNQGIGEPKGYTGMVGTHHRPSDDLSTYAFLTPANAMMSVELANLVTVLESLHPSDATQAALVNELIHNATTWSSRIRDAIYKYALTEEGSRYMMDDANVPSLLSLPYLGFVDKNDQNFQKTRAQLLSRQNPYYSQGPQFFGIGGPHASPTSPWPMSLISAIFSTDSDTEIQTYLSTLMSSTSGLGLIHESVDIHDTTSYTRPWFAWANSYFAEMVLDLAKRKPGLILNTDKPYILGR